MGVWSRKKQELAAARHWQDHRQSESFRQQIETLRLKLQPSQPFELRQHGAHGLATLLASHTEQYAVLNTLLTETEGEILRHLLALASEAERKRDLLTLQLVLSCLANYSFIDPAYVAASSVPVLLAGVFSSGPDHVTIRDPQLHSCNSTAFKPR